MYDDTLFYVVITFAFIFSIISIVLGIFVITTSPIVGTFSLVVGIGCFVLNCFTLLSSV